MPRVSVAMPVFNGQKYVAESIESVLAQTYTDFEFLICDDASTDGTWDILKKYESEDKRIKLFKNETNLNISRTLNKLISHAKGEYLARQDSDDLWIKGKLKIQVNFLDSNNNYGLVASRIKIIGDNGQPLYGKDVEYGEVNELLNFDCVIPHASVVMRIREFQKVFHQSIYRASHDGAEDYDLWSRAKLHIKFYKLKNRLLLYRTHSKQKTIVGSNITQTLASSIIKRNCRLDYDINLSNMADALYFWCSREISRSEFKLFLKFNSKKLQQYRMLKRRLMFVPYFQLAKGNFTFIRDALFNRHIIYFLYRYRRRLVLFCVRIKKQILTKFLLLGMVNSKYD